MIHIFEDEYDYLIHLVECAIYERIPCEMPSHLSFDQVFQHGKEHEIANIAFYSIDKLKIKPTPKLYKSWENVRDMAVVRDMTQEFAREEILAEFKRENIRCMEVQGTKTKRLYPKPEYRTMSDIDFIVDKENLQKGKSILRFLGYRCMDHGCEVDGYREPNIFIELHSDFFDEQSLYYQYLNQPFDHGIGGEETFLVDDYTFYMYSVLHIIKHYYNSGCGIRRVLDLYLLNQKYKDQIDYFYRKSELKESQISDTISLFMKLADYWFGDGDFEDELSDVITFIKTAGVHGTIRHHICNRMWKDIKENEKTKKVKYVYLLRRLFPGTDIMYQYFPVLKKCIILMPFCWVLRWINRIKNNKRNVIIELKEIRNLN